jgi:transcriptional regulator with XRE-family HTH domain
MPKTLNSVTLVNNCVKFIEAYCKREDISEASFSRKFGKNNRWVSDLRRGKNTNLPSKELAVQMCLTLNVSPDDILLHEGKTTEETAKCLEDIETVRKLVEAESAKKAPDSKTEGEDAQLAQLIAGFNRLSPQQKSAVLAVIEGYQPSQE